MNSANDDLTTTWTVPATTSSGAWSRGFISCFFGTSSPTYSSGSKKGWSPLFIFGISGGCLAILFLLLILIAVQRARRSRLIQMENALHNQPPGVQIGYCPTVTVHPLKANHHNLNSAETQPPPYSHTAPPYTAPPYTATEEVLPSYQEVVKDTSECP
jgi:hypothetical protein